MMERIATFAFSNSRETAFEEIVPAWSQSSELPELIDKGEDRQYGANLLNLGPLDALPRAELLTENGLGQFSVGV
ncbi:MAG TPA: hypothetical protein VN519_02420 [Bryobacteraceae bacterium]|nr:hypothetical protein [Bryobacteraceae bacterium]